MSQNARTNEACFHTRQGKTILSECTSSISRGLVAPRPQRHQHEALPVLTQGGDYRGSYPRDRKLERGEDFHFSKTFSCRRNPCERDGPQPALRRIFGIPLSVGAPRNVCFCRDLSFAVRGNVMIAGRELSCPGHDS